MGLCCYAAGNNVLLDCLSSSPGFSMNRHKESCRDTIRKAANDTTLQSVYLVYTLSDENCICSSNHEPVRHPIPPYPTDKSVRENICTEYT